MKTAKNILQKLLFLLGLTLAASGFLAMPSDVQGAACVISATNPSPGEVGTPFNLILTASGGTHAQSSYTWTFSWSLTTVPGLTGPTISGAKNAQVTYSGTPTAAGSWSLIATVVDSGKNRCSLGSATVVVTVNPPPAGLVIDTNSIPSGQVGVAYNATVAASGGTTPYTWSQTGLPAGLSINASTGVITGTPAAGTAGTHTANITVTGGGTATKSFTLTIAAAAIPVDISTPSLPAGQVSIPYSYSMTGTGGTAPYSWSAAGLPPGLTMSAAGLLSGTPTAAGTFNMTVTITDSASGTTSKIYPITINAATVVVTTNMSDYCITPPFITQETLPNLLLIIDNSGSMYDLAYVDKGADERDPQYCYDDTFSSANSYPGYFTETSIYRYNDAAYRFEVSAFPALCDKQVPSIGVAHLCIKGTNLNSTSTPKNVTDFYASGKYLNWLTSSKFDIQKQILTGGKFDAGFQSLIAESRGCVGRRFIKEALTADYVEGGTNTSLGITFGVRGPFDASNPSAPSSGGLTHIDIFAGNYDQGTCQTAIDLYQDPSCGQQCRRDATSSCLNYSSSTTQAGKTSNVFIQSVQECYQFDQDGTVGNDAKNTVKNQCPEVLDFYSPGTCSVTKNKVCTTDANCAAEIPAGQRCMAGSYGILPGNPALLCSSTYTGACYVGSAPYSKSGYTGTVDGHTGDDCVTYMHNKYCGDIKQPPVIDPTDEPSATDFFANVPAILGDAGVQSQLGDALKTLEARVQNASPEGIIHQYKNRIRFGAQGFNYAGSSSECNDTDIVKCPRICSNDKSKACLTFQDCPPASPTPTCDLVTSVNEFKDPATNQFSPNLDSAHVIAYIGDPTYASNPIGDHTSGLIRALDDIRAQTWTPSGEGFYNAVAYFTQNTASGASRPYRLNPTDFTTTTNPIQSNCQKNNILFITDGMSTTDQNSTVRDFVNAYNDGDGQTTTTASASGSVAPKYFGSKNIDDIAWYAQHKNIFDPASTATRKPKDSIKSYVTFTGDPCDPTSAATDCTSCTTNDENMPERLMQQTATNGGGLCRFAKDPAALRQALQTIFDDISGAAASGTAASVLASGEGSGANLIQAVFYPWRLFNNNTEARWIGRLTNLWYYVDPRFGASGIYEDSGSTSASILDLREDNKVTLYYDPVAKLTKAHRVQDTNNDGVADTPIATDINFELLSSLWDGGTKLWKRNLAASPRRIKTTIGGGLIDLSAANAAALKPYLQAADNTEATNVINFTHGADITGYRSRTVTITGLTTDAGSDTGVWRLGDVVQSTPRIATRFALNTYDQTYGDATYKTYIDPSGSYANRGLVFVGANDGMLHALYLGRLELAGAWKDSVYKKAKLADPSSIGLGKEVWAFVPKNVLPYLKYLADPSYCHIYSIDLTPMVFDAAIGAPADGDISNNAKTAASWRTILIGGMRLGGGCVKSDSTCTNCVKTPGVDLNANGSVDTDAEKSLGLSSYFALDITNTLNDPTQDPQLLWEFSTEGMGLTSSGPSVVKINMKTTDLNLDTKFDGEDPSDKSKNGKYFVVFGSGPTGPISTSDHQFKAESSQNLKLYVLDLKTGALATATPIDTGIAEAFSGNIMNTTLDTDLDYQDDVLYVPYVRKCGLSDALHPCTDGTWTDGGVGRLLTREDLDPNHWAWSEVIDGTGPVTASVSKLLNRNAGKLWLYFATGRYFFEQDTADDSTNQRRLYAVKDPCYSTVGFASSCGSASGLTNVTDIADVPTDASDIDVMNGWYINLLGSGSGYRAERVITDPLASVTGLVLFTTFQPKDDSCNPGGRSFLWAAKYDTGGAPGALLKGKGLLQVSTGSIEEVDLQSEFTEEGGRKTPAMEGVPPTAQGLSILASPSPVKRTIHVKER